MLLNAYRYCVEPEMVIGLIAGGEEAMTVAVEGAEVLISSGQEGSFNQAEFDKK